MEQWVTVEDIAAARQRFVDAIPGYEFPVAYGVARIEGDHLTFGHVNEVGGTHLLPAVVLATVCGYTAGNATYVLDVETFDRAIASLAPAEACAAYEHPNLWSWRALREGASDEDTFVAVFVSDLAAPPVDHFDAEFRNRLHS
jgi:hypothetical protein